MLAERLVAMSGIRYVTNIHRPMGSKESCMKAIALDSNNVGKILVYNIRGGRGRIHMELVVRNIDTRSSVDMSRWRALGSYIKSLMIRKVEVVRDVDEIRSRNDKSPSKAVDMCGNKKLAELRWRARREGCMVPIDSDTSKN